MNDPAVFGDGAVFSGDGAGELTQLRQHIVRTREELGSTMGALAARTDLRGRMRETAQETKTRVRQSAARAARGSVPWVVLLGAATAAVVIVVLKRRAR